MNHKTIAIIGAGIAGLEASVQLAKLDYQVKILEKKATAGGHLNDWFCLFPDLRPSKEILDNIKYNDEKNVQLFTEAEISSIDKTGDQFTLNIKNGNPVTADAILLTTGFKLFDARKKEEYGYGIYDNVITSKDLEKTYFPKETIKTHNGKTPDRIGIIHCVGSRDEKAGNRYCSKVCCVTGVKQAIEIRKMMPQTEVFCFYMDLRMFGRHYEELYMEAQEKWHVNFIRGRLSEACENTDGSLLLKVEDTLAGKPLKMKVDMMVLLAGFTPAEGTANLAESLGLSIGEDGFLLPADEHNLTNLTTKKGVFVAGTCTGPKSVPETLADARVAALAIHEYFSK